MTPTIADDAARQALELAGALVRRGVLVIVARPAPAGSRSEFRFPRWKNLEPSIDALRLWEPGYALAAATGHAFDVIDIDPRNGGDATYTSLLGAIPQIAGEVATPGGGRHLYCPPTGGSSVHAGGIDYQAHGSLIYLPGTLRPKYSGLGYRWIRPLDWSVLKRPGDSGFAGLLRAHAASADGPTATAASAPSPTPEAGLPMVRWTAFGRAALLRECDAVAATTTGRNTSLNRAAFRCGQLIPAGHMTDRGATEYLMDAAAECGLVADDGTAACLDTVRSGLRAGARKTRS